jgi:hypothetical protein
LSLAAAAACSTAIDTATSITSQPRLVCGAVKFDQNLIDLCLTACVAAKKRTGNFSVDMAHSARHPKSAEAGIAVTQIDGFATAFGGA